MLLELQVSTAPIAGDDVVLTIEPALQRFAEQLLDRFHRQMDLQTGNPDDPLSGGAILVMDAYSGEVVTAASEPRFDPNSFAAGDSRVEAILDDPRQPLFDRATRMAIPPGSVFKPLTAIALLEHGVVDPQTPFACQGFLHEPDSMRCQIFRHHGIGHGDVTLADALAQSCNVYFFHHVSGLGGPRLLDWASRFGFGQASAAGSNGGRLPSLTQLEQPGQLQAFAIGQGTLTATPVEIARLYAAIANGGLLVPVRLYRATHVESRRIQPLGKTASQVSEDYRIRGLSGETLATVRKGLRRVVNDAAGTAFHTVRMNDFAISGKTGTAQAGDQRQDHAWFAGYAPADAPRFVFVIALQHGGSGSDAAGTMARHLVLRMRQLGYFGEAKTAEKDVPPGRG